MDDEKIIMGQKKVWKIKRNNNISKKVWMIKKIMGKNEVWKIKKNIDVSKEVWMINENDGLERSMEDKKMMLFQRKYG